MPTATGNSTARIIRWVSNDVSVRYFDIYRRSDNVTASITTSDIVAKVGFGSNHFVDVSNGITPYWYWVRAISWAGNSSGFSDTITSEASSDDLVVGGNLTVCGTTTLNGTLSVNSASNISGALTVDGATTIKNTLTVSGATTLNSTLDVTGATTIDGVTKINNTLDVTGAATFGQSVTIASAMRSAYIELTASADPPTPLTGGMIRLYAKDTGGTTVACIIDTAGTVTQLGSGGSLTLDGLTDVDTSGVAEGDVIAYSSSGTWVARAQSGGGGYALFIEEGAAAKVDTDGQDAHLNFDADDFDVTVGSGESATVTLADGLKLGGGLTVSGTATVDSLSVSGTATIGGATKINSTLQVTGAVTLGSTLTVSGALSVNDAANISGALTVDGATVLKNTLTVSGVSTFNNNIAVTGTGTFDGAVKINNTLQVTGATTIDGATKINNTLQVTGATTLGSTLTVSGVTSINANANISGSLTVDGAVILKSTVGISGVLTVNNNANISGALTVDGATKINNTLQVTGAVTLGSTLTVSGNVTVNAAVSVTGSLTVHGVTSLRNLVSISGETSINNNLKVSGSLSVDGSAVLSGPVAINNTVVVSGITTLLGRVLVSTQCGEATAAIGLYRPWTANTSGHYGVHIYELVAHATPNTTGLSGVGLGGYAGLTNTLFGAVYNLFGLDFMPYEVGVTVGHTAYLSTYGIRTGGAAGFAGNFNALAIYGLDVGMVSQAGADYGSVVNAGTGYGIYIENGAGLGGTKTIGTAYQLYINGIASVTVDANKWMIWANDGKSYFRQNVSGAAGDVLHLQQDHTAGATGCLKMTQDHQGYDFMHFVSPASAGTSYSINTTERNTFNCMIAIKVNGTIRWLKAYA